ncbi:hypothetical protein AVEN_6549-1, partial [Araneus ventricosus]
GRAFPPLHSNRLTYTEDILWNRVSNLESLRSQSLATRLQRPEAAQEEQLDGNACVGTFSANFCTTPAGGRFPHFTPTGSHTRRIFGGIGFRSWKAFGPKAGALPLGYSDPKHLKKNSC